MRAWATRPIGPTRRRGSTAGRTPWPRRCGSDGADPTKARLLPGLRRTLQEATERHEQAHERELRLARTGRRPAPASSAKRFLIAGGVLAALVVVARALARGPAGGEAEPDVPPPRPSPPR